VRKSSQAGRRGGKERRGEKGVGEKESRKGEEIRGGEKEYESQQEIAAGGSGKIGNVFKISDFSYVSAATRKSLQVRRGH